MNTSSSNPLPDLIPLMKRFGTSLGAAYGGYVLLATIRSQHLLSLGLTSQEINSVRSLALVLTLLINTPLSAYADRINRTPVLALGSFLQIISSFLYFIVAQKFSSSAQKWLWIALVYFLLELGKYATHDTLGSIAMRLFSKKSAPSTYAQYTYIAQRRILYFASGCSVLSYLLAKIFGFQSCFLIASLLLIYARMILTPNALISFLKIEEKTSNSIALSSLQQSQEQSISAPNRWLKVLAPLWIALNHLLSRSWGICALFSTIFLGIIREYVVHFWQILLFKERLHANPNMEWRMIAQFIGINVGFTLTSLFFIWIMKRFNRQQKGPSLLLLSAGVLGGALVGCLNPHARVAPWNTIIGLCACFGAQEISHMMIYQFFARTVNPNCLNTTQHLLHIFSQLSALLALRFVNYFPHFENQKIFQSISLIFIFLWIALFFWKKLAFETPISLLSNKGDNETAN